MCDCLIDDGVEIMSPVLPVNARVLSFLPLSADTLLPILTVEEMLLYTAELKRPRSEPLSSKKAAVDELLQKLALTSCRCANLNSTWFA